MKQEYEEAKTWIHRIEISYARNGTIITILSNNGYEDSYIYSHNSMIEGVNCQAQDIMDAISKTLEIKEMK